MKKIQLLFGGLILFMAFASPVLAHAGDSGYDGHGMMSGSWIGMGFFGWIFMILILIALVLFIVWLAKQIQEPNRRHK